MVIKDILSKQVSVCEYIWEVVACIVIICKGHLSPDIWPKTFNLAISTKDIILTIYYKKIIKQIKTRLPQYYLLEPGLKEVYYASVKLLFKK